MTYQEYSYTLILSTIFRVFNGLLSRRPPGAFTGNPRRPQSPASASVDAGAGNDTPGMQLSMVFIASRRSAGFHVEVLVAIHESEWFICWEGRI